MYQLLSEISQVLSRPFLSIVQNTTNIPLLAAFVLGLIGALAPCQITGNVGAITFYGNRSLQTKNQWVNVVFFIFGKIVVFSLLGLAVWAIGQSFRLSLPTYFSFFRKIMGPIIIIMGLVLIGFVKLKWMNKIMSRIPQYRGEGKLASFIMGVSFSIAFCPTMFTLFFFTLMPIVISAPYGAILPSVFGIGTSVPVVILLFLIWFFEMEGTLLKKSRKIGSIVQKTAGFLLVLVGVLDTVTYWS